MKIIVENIATEYQDEGIGEVILLLHGWQDNLRTFDEVTKSLMRTKRVVRLDLPGFGKSEGTREAWEVEQYSQFVADFIKKLNLKIEIIVGHSFGGRIIIKGVALKKLEAKKIVLIGAAGVGKKRKFRNMFLKILAKIGWWIKYLPGVREKVYKILKSDYGAAGKLKKTFVKVIGEDLSQWAKKITIPTLLIWGKNDSETPVTEGEHLAKLIAGAKIKVIENSGHFVHQEKPKEMAKLIEQFLC